MGLLLVLLVEHSQKLFDLDIVTPGIDNQRAQLIPKTMSQHDSSSQEKEKSAD